MLIRGSAILRNQTPGDGGDSPASPPAAVTFTEAQLAEIAKALSPTINAAITGHLSRRPSVADEIAKLDWDPILLPVVTKFIEGDEPATQGTAPAAPAAPQAPATDPAIEQLKTAVKGHADRLMASLTAEQQTAVRKVAPDTDPAAQLNAIDALAPTWTTPAVAAPQAAPAAPPTPASGTAPAPAAPAPASVSQPNHKEIHAQLAKKNPFAAASYGLSHLDEVFPDTPQS